MDSTRAGEQRRSPARGASGVVLVHWPQEHEQLLGLRAAGTPRLLLLEHDVDPPQPVDCAEDWLRVPADDRDVRARIAALLARCSHHGPPAEARGDGVVRVGTDWVVLSPIEDRLATLLVHRFGELVAFDELTETGWGGPPPNESSLRVHIFRLRRRLRPLSLDVRCVPGRGYVVDHLAPLPSTAT
jgi:two-component system, OmpR family, response regulator